MRVRYHNGYLRLVPRKTRSHCWEFLWWDIEPAGRGGRRTTVIGTLQELPSADDAGQASNGLRVSSNEVRDRQREQSVTVGDLIDHYIEKELSSDLGDRTKSHAPAGT